MKRHEDTDEPEWRANAVATSAERACRSSSERYSLRARRSESCTESRDSRPFRRVSQSRTAMSDKAALGRSRRSANARLLPPEEIERSKDPAVIPPVVLFRYRKRFESPTAAEGFDSVVRVDGYRHAFTGTGKALFVDYDG